MSTVPAFLGTGRPPGTLTFYVVLRVVLGVLCVSVVRSSPFYFALFRAEDVGRRGAGLGPGVVLGEVEGGFDVGLNVGFDALQVL
jgi:hypothetical protein